MTRSVNWLWVAIVAACAFLLALIWATSSQAAYGPNIYWTTDKAEQIVYDSSWGERHNIVLVTCDGVGRGRKDATGQPVFNKLVCEADYDATFYGDAFGCTLAVSVRPVTDTRFALSGGTNPRCYPDQGYVIGN